MVRLRYLAPWKIATVVDLSREPAPSVCAAGIGGAYHGQYWIEEDDVPQLPKKKPGIRLKKTAKRVDVGGARRLTVRSAEPAPTVMAGGIGSVNTSQYAVEPSGDPSSFGKPPYRVPPMAEVAAVPWNGMTVASTFSGCGGSCLGYRMAGFRVAWANEFVPHAQECYEANAAPGSVLDGRDVKLIQPEEILKVLGVKRGELDLFDGSPPCQAFSTAGKRHKGWGESKRYEGGHEQRNETLFDEYVRLLRGLAPRTFVAENVSGLVKGTCKGVFLEVLAALKRCGYRVSARVLDAQWLGVPQVRQRVIFVGVREDLADAGGLPLQPRHPLPLPWRYSVLDAIPWLSGRAVHESGGFSRTDTTSRPSPTVTMSQCRLVEEPDRVAVVQPKIEWSGRHAQGLKRSIAGPSPTINTSNHEIDLVGALIEPGASVDGLATGERRKFSIAELKRICSFPDDFALHGPYAKQWERLGNSVPPVMAFWIARAVRDGVLRRERGRRLPAPRDPACLVAGGGGR